MILSIAAALFAAQPGAASLAIGSCAADRMSAADRQIVAAGVQQGGAPEPALVERMLRHVASCTPANGQASGDAVASAATLIVNAEIGRDLSRSGVDPKLVERFHAEQSDSVKIVQELTPAQEEALLRGLIARGAPEAAVFANPEKIGGYLGTLIVLERIRRGLSVSE